MMQQDDNGNWVPTKVFPCDCGSEGLTVAPYEWEEGELCFSVAFWQVVPKYSGNQMTWSSRIRMAWNALRGRPWLDMVDLTPDVAKNLANHILYKLEQVENNRKKKNKMPEVDRLF